MTVVQAFDRDGYALARDILSSSELDALRDEMTRMIDTATVNRETSTDRHGDLVDHPTDFTFSDVDNDTQALSRISNQLARSAVMRTIYANPSLLKLVASVYGREFVPFAESIIVKLPDHGAEIPYHQDGTRYDVRHRGLNVGIYLHASTEANGCLRVVPGSHTEGKQDVHTLRETHGPILPGSIPLVAAPGDISLHDRTLIHGSLPNTSPDLRITVYFGYHKLESVRGIHDSKQIRRRAQVVSLCIQERQQLDQYGHERPYDYALADIAPVPITEAERISVLRTAALGL